MTLALITASPFLCSSHSSRWLGKETGRTVVWVFPGIRTHTAVEPVFLRSPLGRFIPPKTSDVVIGQHTQQQLADVSPEGQLSSQLPSLHARRHRLARTPASCFSSSCANLWCSDIVASRRMSRMVSLRLLIGTFSVSIRCTTSVFDHCKPSEVNVHVLFFLLSLALVVAIQQASSQGLQHLSSTLRSRACRIEFSYSLGQISRHTLYLKETISSNQSDMGL